MIAFGIGRSFEEEAEADLAAHSDRPSDDQILAAHGPLYKLRVLIPPALLVFYALAADRLGFYLTTALIILVASLTFGGRLRLAVPLALLAPLLVHLAFYKLLRVPFPSASYPCPGDHERVPRSLSPRRGSGRPGRDPGCIGLRSGRRLPSRAVSHHGHRTPGAGDVLPVADRRHRHDHLGLGHGDLFRRYPGLPSPHPRHPRLGGVYG